MWVVAVWFLKLREVLDRRSTMIMNMPPRWGWGVWGARAVTDIVNCSLLGNSLVENGEVELG